MRKYILITCLGFLLFGIGCGEAVRTEKPLSVNVRADKALSGTYYQGDGLGYNLHLELKSDGQFECRWTGCLGEYGATQGAWGREGDSILVVASKSSGMFDKSPLGDMRVITQDGEQRLLREEDSKYLNDADMLRFFTFARKTDPMR